jgi:signal transduction histidine kinase
MQSIYNRLVILSVLFLIILSVFGYLSYLELEKSQYILIERSAYLQSQTLKNNISSNINAFASDSTGINLDLFLQLLKRQTSTYKTIKEINIIDDNDNAAFSSNDMRINKKIILPQENGKYGIYKYDFTENEVKILLKLNISEFPEYQYLLVLINPAKFENFLGKLPDHFVGILIVFGLLFILSIYLVSRAYEVPFRSLNNALSKLNAEDYTYRVKYERQDEFTTTFDNLNRAIEKVSFLKEGYKKAEKRISSLLQAVNESIIILDLTKDITSNNDAALILFQSEGKEFSEWFKKILSTNIELNNTVSQALKNRTHIVEKKISVFLPNDKEIYVKMNVESLGEEETIQGVILTFKDLQSIAELENNLFRSMKFGIITNLASSISHEIKNPLSAMAMHSEIIKSKIEPLEFKDKNKAQISIDTLQNEVKRLNGIIQQFLSLTKPSKLELELININKVVNDVITLVQQQAQEQSIKINTNLQMKIETIYGEESQLKQVLLNLILNAFAVMPSGGDLGIETKSINHKFFIEISDTGNGIPKKIQSKIFDLYFTTKKDGGGIGLSICKNIMEVHEGKLYFKSKIGKGTTFTMEFPAKEKTTLYTSRFTKSKDNN